MRRKNRKWVALAVILYLFVMYSAYRWAIAQRPSYGYSMLTHIQNEEVRKYKERKAAEAALAARTQIQPTAESRLNAAGPAYVAARYDSTHVVFMVATDVESRFSSTSSVRLISASGKIPASEHPCAPLAGFSELWEPDAQALHFFPAVVGTARLGDQWTLSANATSTIPVVIERTVIAASGCSLAMGFLASVPPDSQTIFKDASQEYFLVRRAAVESANPPIAAHIADLPEWKTPAALAQQIEQQLNERMKQELSNIDRRLLANANSPGATAGELPIGNARPHLREWLHADQGLARGEGALDYDIHAYRLTPDSVPRLFVRARWKLADNAVFLMTAWFKADWPKTEFQKTTSHSDDEPPVFLWSDASWSLAMRQGEAPATLGDSLDFQTILNEFDADHDGWAELLVHSYDVSSPDSQLSGTGAHPGPSATIAPYLYTDQGLVRLKAAFHRDLQSPESCLEP